MKQCRRCEKVLPIEQFYVHSRMKDGHLNFCKDCVKTRVGKHRAENLEAIQLYDRTRGRTEHRLARAREYQQRTWDRHMERLKLDIETNPEKYRARYAVSNAIRDGRLIRQNCFCGDTAEAHHPDYSQPLSVQWLCTKHHKEIHRKYQ